MTLNLAQRSFKVIDFGTNRKRIYLLVVSSNLDPILHRSAVKWFSKNSNLYDHDTSTSQTDGQTD